MQESHKFDRRRAIRYGTQGAVVSGLGAMVAQAGHTTPTATSMILRSIREFGVSPTATSGANRRALQDAIDWASSSGAGLWVDPTEEPYPVDPGLRLRRNVSLVGVHGSVPRVARHAKKAQPVGSVFSVDSPDAAFIEVESATQLCGLQFWYPAQATDVPEKVIEFPPTVRRADSYVTSVTLRSLALFGEFVGFDFRGGPAAATGEPMPTELLLFEHCYGYPLSGRFIEIDYCYDIPRILHCHVNPANRVSIAKPYNARKMIDGVIARQTYCYHIDHTDNAQLIDLFAFGVHGGLRLGPESYGQLTNFNFDCVTVGIHKSGSQQKNRNWQIAQGSIIANAGGRTEDLHPFVIDGLGHTSIANVECFCGANPVVSSPTAVIDGQECIVSEDFILIEGNERLTLTLAGCRASNFRAKDPIRRRNQAAIVATHGCFMARGTGESVEAYPDGILPA